MVIEEKIRHGNYLRVRGEYRHTIYANTQVSELPPRARRILEISTLTKSAKGTTSACAENTVLLFLGGGVLRNYLRVRGEYPK